MSQLPLEIIQAIEKANQVEIHTDAELFQHLEKDVVFLYHRYCQKRLNQKEDSFRMGLGDALGIYADNLINGVVRDKHPKVKHMKDHSDA